MTDKMHNSLFEWYIDTTSDSTIEYLKFIGCNGSCGEKDIYNLAVEINKHPSFVRYNFCQKIYNIFFKISDYFENFTDEIYINFLWFALFTFKYTFYSIDLRYDDIEKRDIFESLIYRKQIDLWDRSKISFLISLLLTKFDQKDFTFTYGSSILVCDDVNFIFELVRNHKNFNERNKIICFFVLNSFERRNFDFILKFTEYYCLNCPPKIHIYKDIWRRIKSSVSQI